MDAVAKMRYCRVRSGPSHRDESALALLRQLGEHGIDFKDLHSSESSLEDIFVSPVHADAARPQSRRAGA